MKQIYTKTGDEGQTSLRGGVRVAKDDLRIEANGQIDMLNSLLALVVLHRGMEKDTADLLSDVQRELMTVMSHVATPDGDENPRPLHCDELTTRMEQAIDLLTQHRKATGFVVPGSEGTAHAAMLHVARAQCRTAERRLWTVKREYRLNPAILRMLNRLSDFLFALSQSNE